MWGRDQEACRKSKPSASEQKAISYLAAIIQDLDRCFCAVVHELHTVEGQESQGPSVAAGVSLIPGSHVLAEEGEVLVSTGTEQAKKCELGYLHRIAFCIHVGELEVENRRT